MVVCWAFLCFIRRQLWVYTIKMPDKLAATIWRKVAGFEPSHLLLGF